MFSLIITVISLSLVAIIAVATLYYGGAAFTQGHVEARAAKLLNEAQQIQGAATLFQQDRGVLPTDFADLVSLYLTTVPDSGWMASPTEASVQVEGSEICLAFNAKLGVEGIPSCSAVTDTRLPVCCQ